MNLKAELRYFYRNNNKKRMILPLKSQNILNHNIFGDYNMNDKERAFNPEPPKCTVTTVNGFQYLTIPETKLMDYVVDDSNIETAARAIYDEAFDSLLPDSEIKVAVCNSILESYEMKEIIRQIRNLADSHVLSMK